MRVFRELKTGLNWYKLMKTGKIGIDNNFQTKYLKKTLVLTIF